MDTLLVGVGGACGAVARFLVGDWTVRHFGAGFPYATLGINLVGSALLGLLLAGLAAGRMGEGDALRLLVGTGFCGGFTTFSAFSVETVTLVERGRLDLAALYVVLSVAGSIAAAAAGFALVRLSGAR